MNNTCKFNLVKYVYGRCFEAHLLNQPLIIKSQWKNILKWLEKNKYIQNLKFNYDTKTCTITYNFNTKKIMYEYYLKGVKRNVELIKNNANLSIIPMGEILNKEKIDEFEQERLNSFNKTVEYIDKNDRVRRTMTQEEIYNMN